MNMLKFNDSSADRGYLEVGVRYHIIQKGGCRGVALPYNRYPILGWSLKMTVRGEHSLRVGWRNFFPVVLLCQFFGFWWEIGFGVTYLRI